MAIENIAGLLNGNIFFQIALITICASFFGFLAQRLKQPLIVGYLIAGLLLRPVFIDIFHINMKDINVLAEIGIAFMLFIVGLELDFKKLQSVKKVAILGGIFSTFVVFLSALFISLSFGFNLNQSLYLGVIFSFSSTMIILKLLYDKNELDTIHGRIIVGYLLIQDVIAIIITPILSQLENFVAIGIVINLLKVGLFLGLTYLISKFVLPPLFRTAAANQELLVLTAVATSLFFSFVALNIGNLTMAALRFIGVNSNAISLWAKSGLSLAIGAFLGGVAIANHPYAFEIISKINPLKDFFATIFFVSLGLELSFPALKAMFLPLIVIVFFTLFLKPLITLIVTGFFRYGKKISFQVASPMMQVSEFGLIIAMQGLTEGILDKGTYSMVISAAIIGAALTPYFLNNSTLLYRKLGKFFSFIDKYTDKSTLHLFTEAYQASRKLSPQVILCGCNRTGYPILKKVIEMRKSVVVIDYNPKVVERLANENITAIYGDATDPDILDLINFENLQIFISTSQDLDDNLFLLKEVRRRNKKAIVFLSASDVDDALLLYEKGSDYVIIPRFLGGAHASLLVERLNEEIDGLIKHKQQHIQELLERKRMGKHHPLNK